MIKIHADITQGSDEWHAQRCGLLTASEMKLIITPTLKIADNDKTRAHLYELMAQRINKYVEPRYVSDDMMRGKDDEIDAFILYTQKIAPAVDVGFITNDDYGFTLGYSPDGVVGEDGLIECKSRRQKYQVETILNDEVPAEYIMQIQTGLLVSGRKWCDFISYCGGMPMYVKRVESDEKIQAAIIEAATQFHAKLDALMEDYYAKSVNLFPTERRIELEMHL